jgi:WD40 repeat protein
MSRLQLFVLIGNIFIVQQARADQLIYIEEDGGNGNPRGLYNFDINTGTSTFRAPLTETARFNGLAVRPSDGTVFSVSPDQSRSAGFANRLWTIDVNTGAATFVGDISTGDAICNIAFNPFTNVLYGLERNNRRLFTIDQITAKRTNVGTTDSVTGSGFDFSPNGTLFATTYQGQLYTIDPLNAQDTVVGGSSIEGDLFEDAAFSPAGLMYVTDYVGKIWRLDTTTGVQTLVGGTDMGFGLIGVIYVVPEPNSATLMIFGLSIVIRRRVRPLRRHP